MRSCLSDERTDRQIPSCRIENPRDDSRGLYRRLADPVLASAAQSLLRRGLVQIGKGCGHILPGPNNDALVFTEGLAIPHDFSAEHVIVRLTTSKSWCAEHTASRAALHRLVIDK